MQSRMMRLAATTLLALPLLALPALAAGDGGSGGDETVTNCKKGEVWDKKLKQCVPPKQSMIDDESIYEAGRALAKAERYDEAITVLSLAADKTDPRILNYLGYSHRKSGRVQVGIGYYEEALRRDPNYVLVREYLGEAHLQTGDVVAARAQLTEIEKRTGKGSEEYADLAEQIDAFVKG